VIPLYYFLKSYLQVLEKMKTIMDFVNDISYKRAKPQFEILFIMGYKNIEKSAGFVGVVW
jgi:hypothetical protein